MGLTQVSTAGVKDDAVTSGKIPANAIGSSEIAANAVGSSELADDAVDTNAIVDDAVTADKLANSINTEIAANTAKTTNATHTGDVTGSSSLTIASNAVTTAKIADEAVTLAKLPHGTSSNDGKFLRANNGADPSFETVSIPAGTTLNGNTDSYVMTGTGTSNTLQGEANLQFDGTSLSLNKGGLTNAQKLVIQGSNNSSGDALTLNNWGNSDGDYWTLGVNMTANSGGSFAKTDTNLRCVGVNLDGRMGRIIFNASETSSSTISDAHTFTRDGNHYMNGSLYLGGETSSNNELDDYEEGTFSPAIGGSSNIDTYNLSGSGKYTKIGNKVDIHMSWSGIDLNNSASGNVMIKSLPFTSSGFQYTTSTDHYLYNVGFNTGRIQSWYVNTNATNIEGIESIPDSGWTSWSVGNFTAGNTYLRVHVSYLAS